jgi:hypothetical protein
MFKFIGKAKKEILKYNSHYLSLSIDDLSI